MKHCFILERMTIHVDDFNAEGDDTFKKKIRDKLFEAFECRKRQIGKFIFTSLDIEGKVNCDIAVSQEEYLKHIYFIAEDKKEDKVF